MLILAGNHAGREEIPAALRQLAGMVERAGTYRTLVVFEATADLSEPDAETLKAIRDEARALYRRLNVARRAGAAIIDRSRDAEMVTRLYNALCEAEAGLDLHLELFATVEEAADWLELPREVAVSAVARTGT